MGLREVLGIGALAGIGLTVSFLVANLAFTDQVRQNPDLLTQRDIRCGESPALAQRPTRTRWSRARACPPSRKSLRRDYRRAPRPAVLVTRAFAGPCQEVWNQAKLAVLVAAVISGAVAAVILGKRTPTTDPLEDATPS